AVTLAQHPEREPRLAAVRLLAKAGAGQAARDALRLAQHDRDQRIALVAAAGLDRLDGRPSSLRARLAKPQRTDERWLLYDAIGAARLVDPAAAVLLKAAAFTGPAGLRPKAAEAFGHAARDDAVPALVKLLEQRRPWQIAIGAARGLAATRAVTAIPPLIKALGKAAGRRRAEIARALASLTGRSFGEMPTHWERWWAARGHRFRVPVAPPSRWERAPNGTGFFGVEIRTNAAVFLCDVSASMVGKPLQRLQSELAGAVKRFPPGGRFNLVFFGDEVYPWATKLQRVSKTARSRALAHIHAQRTGGATNLGDALIFALDDAEVDTIVLLTDGLPTVGRFKHISELRDYFERRNRVRMVELHVICIGMRSSDLRDMAEMSGGRYVER
ncbi:MAG: VWA domain-containing protein, partial [Planctomycetota bacterium]|nr:VWA domain-containing protein [Planctomycetota bacterium]